MQTLAQAHGPAADFDTPSSYDPCFAAHFTRTVGVPPGNCLTGWRTGVVRQLLRKGLAVKLVAADIGYASSGAFGRVFL